jgi:hypothetical protein
VVKFFLYLDVGLMAHFFLWLFIAAVVLFFIINGYYLNKDVQKASDEELEEENES